MRYPVRRWAVLIVSSAWCLMAIPTGSQACSLVEREAVELALGAVGEARVGVNNGIAMSCSFPIKRGGSVSILLRRNADRAWMAEQQQRMKMGGRFGRFYSEAGLEGQAFVLDMRDAGAAICVFGADYYLQVSVFKAGAAVAVLPGAEKLAALTVARLLRLKE